MTPGELCSTLEATELTDLFSEGAKDEMAVAIEGRINGYTTLSVVASLLGGFALSMLTAAEASGDDFDFAFYIFLATAIVTTCVNLTAALVLALAELSVKRMLGAPSKGSTMASVFMQRTARLRSNVVHSMLYGVPLFVVSETNKLTVVSPKQSVTPQNGQRLVSIMAHAAKTETKE